MCRGVYPTDRRRDTIGPQKFTLNKTSIVLNILGQIKRVQRVAANIYGAGKVMGASRSPAAIHW